MTRTAFAILAMSKPFERLLRDLLSPEPSEQYCIFFVLSSSISQRFFKQISFIHVDKDDPAEVVNLGDKEEEEVTDEVVFDKMKVVKLVSR